MIHELTPRFGWMKEPRLQAILDALRSRGEARFVGGCVRDGLLGKSPLETSAIDIDIATDRTPSEMKVLFDDAGMKAIATGEAHGTMTAVASGLVAECTTLRADIATDGRRAEVRFTRDWDEDWRRRDFTINALYADDEGKVWDPAGGMPDLEAGHVRFIGDPGDRIREDALRILRFFRFSARFADALDPQGLEAIKAHTDLLGILSKERIWSELSRSFSAPRAPGALAAAGDAGVFAAIMPGTARTEVFARLHHAGHAEVAASLVALWPGVARSELRRFLRPPNGVLDLYEAIEAARAAIADGMSAHELLYRFPGGAPFLAAQVAMAEGEAVDPALVAAVHAGSPPVLPISGRHVIERGVPAGPQVTVIQQRFERMWLDAGAPMDPATVDRLLDEALRSEAPG